MRPSALLAPAMPVLRHNQQTAVAGRLNFEPSLFFRLPLLRMLHEFRAPLVSRPLACALERMPPPHGSFSMPGAHAPKASFGYAGSECAVPLAGLAGAKSLEARGRFDLASDAWRRDFVCNYIRVAAELLRDQPHDSTEDRLMEVVRSLDREAPTEINSVASATLLFMAYNHQPDDAELAPLSLEAPRPLEPLSKRERAALTIQKMLRLIGGGKGRKKRQPRARVNQPDAAAAGQAAATADHGRARFTSPALGRQIQAEFNFRWRPLLE